MSPPSETADADGELVISATVPHELLPVTIRNSQLGVVSETIADGTIRKLPAGLYLVSAYLPDGDTLRATVDVKPGHREKVEFAPPISKVDNPPQTVFAPTWPSADWVADRLRFVGRRVLSKQAPWELRFLSFHGIEQPNRYVPQIEHVESEDVGGTRGEKVFRIGVSGQSELGSLFAQITSPGRIPLNLALPIGPGGSPAASQCLVHVTTSADSVGLSVSLADSRTDLGLRYLMRGLDSQAATVVDIEIARDLLFHKIQNPIAAAAGALVLLRLGQTDRLEHWPENLMNWFPWLPDGAAIAGERLARLGEHDQALDRLLEIADRGVPIFSDALSMATARLGSYSSGFGKRSDYAALLYRRMVGWAALDDPSTPTVTVRTSDVHDPLEGSQLPLTKPVGEPALSSSSVYTHGR